MSTQLYLQLGDIVTNLFYISLVLSIVLSKDTYSSMFKTAVIFTVITAVIAGSFLSYEEIALIETMDLLKYQRD